MLYRLAKFTFLVRPQNLRTKLGHIDKKQYSKLVMLTINNKNKFEFFLSYIVSISIRLPPWLTNKQILKVDKKMADKLIYIRNDDGLTMMDNDFIYCGLQLVVETFGHS